MAFGNVEQNFDEEGIRKDERERIIGLIETAIEFCPNRSLCLHYIEEIRNGNDGEQK